jgi:tRNA(Ile)-lysidine synthase
VTADPGSRRGARGRDWGPREPGAIAGRLDDALRKLDVDPLESGRTWVIALSGGLDSCVLLHLLRFTVRPRARLVAAHFDHAMRPGSAADARWVRGLCAAWGVEYACERATLPPSSEAEAREARYRFLDRLRERSAPARVFTAHHADDQAETVLFRILRGTGIAGLRGIPGVREPGIVRPLLGFWREELEAYAASVGLRWRDDPTNEHLGFARNALRHEVLPMVEASVSSGARRALVRLAAVADGEEEAWAEVLPGVLSQLGLSFGSSGRHGLSLDRQATAALGPALRGRVLRWAVARVGGAMDDATTRRAVAFVEEGASGAGVELGGGLQLRRELDRLELTGHEELDADEGLVIGGPGQGRGRAILGGRAIPVTWHTGETRQAAIGRESRERPAPGHEASFPLGDVVFPLTLRGRRPGDRVCLPGGTSKLKKVLLAARIPPAMRTSVPVLVDAAGRVLWVPGVARAVLPEGAEGAAEDRTLTIRIEP